MRDYVLPHMWPSFRHSLITGHQFYVDEARKRLLSQFNNIEAEADKASEDWLERSSARFDPDRHDPADFYEGAADAGIEFYGLLSDMREQTYLNVVAGMFHEWDKQLRGWLVREMEHWYHGEGLPKKIWSADFFKLCEFLESLGWEIFDKDYYQTLNTCRLVVNVYKHGQGKSLDDLKAQHPEYFPDPLKGLGCSFLGGDYRDHTHLKVSEKQFEVFSEAIVKFWKAVPENVRESEVEEYPSWCEKVVLKDRASQQQAKNQ